LEAKACARYIRIAPRKSRLVIDMIRGKNAAESAVILQFSTREASKAVLKVLNSAVANAVNKGASGAENLLVTEAFVDEGPILKRFKPRARGSASRINKRTSHITLVLNEIEKTEEKTTRTTKPTKTDKAAPAKAEKKTAKEDKKETKKPAAKKEPKVKKAKEETKPEESGTPSPAEATEGKKEDTSGSES
jgi:large subunit ribosomal protein L22